MPRPVLRPPSFRLNGCRGSVSGSKGPERDADHSSVQPGLRFSGTTPVLLLFVFIVRTGWLYLRTALSWVITQRRVVIYYRRFGVIYRYHLQGSRIKKCFVLDSWPLKMGPIGCPETSVINYHYSLRNNPQERSSQLLRG